MKTRRYRGDLHKYRVRVIPEVQFILIIYVEIPPPEKNSENERPGASENPGILQPAVLACSDCRIVQASPDNPAFTLRTIVESRMPYVRSDSAVKFFALALGMIREILLHTELRRAASWSRRQTGIYTFFPEL